MIKTSFSDFSFVSNFNSNEMKRYVLIFGLVIGTIWTAIMIYMAYLMYTTPDIKTNDVLGYALMIIIWSIIFFGVRNYRNKQLGGVISFGKAFKTGVWISLVASTLYVAVWLFYYYLFVPDWLDAYIAHCLKQASASELAAKTAEMETLREMYKNPLFVILYTYVEVLPIGLVISLVSALILKKKSTEEINKATY